MCSSLSSFHSYTFSSSITDLCKTVTKLDLELSLCSNLLLSYNHELSTRLLYCFTTPLSRVNQNPHTFTCLHASPISFSECGNPN
jgi:hypothetical protein